MTLPIAPASLRIQNPVSTVQGASDSLAAINTAKLPDNSLVMVQASNTLYVLRKGSTATQSLPEIVEPAEGGPGRWYRYSQGAAFFQNVDIGYPEVPPNEGVNSNPVVVDGVDSLNDIIMYNVIGSGIPTPLVVGAPRISGTGVAVWRMANVSGATIVAGTVSARVAVLIGA